MATRSFLGRLRKSVTMTDRQESTARRASRILPRRVSSGSASLGTRFRNQSWMAGCAAVFPGIQPDPAAAAGGAVVKRQGEAVPVEHPHPAVAQGAGSEELHRVREAAQGLHDGVGFDPRADVLPRPVHHDGADHHPRRRKPVKVRDLLQNPRDGPSAQRIADSDGLSSSCTPYGSAAAVERLRIVKRIRAETANPRNM